MLGLGPDKVIKYGLLLGVAYVGYRVFKAELPTIQSHLGLAGVATPTAAATPNGAALAGITANLGLPYVLPQPGHGPPTDALLTCPAGSYVTYAGQILNVDQIRATLVGQNVPNAATLPIDQLLTQYMAVVGPVLPC